MEIYHYAEQKENDFKFLKSFVQKGSKVDRTGSYYAEASKRSRAKRKQEEQFLREQVQKWESERVILTSEIDKLNSEFSYLQLSTRRKIRDQALALENVQLRQELKRFRVMSTSLKKFLTCVDEDLHRERLKADILVKSLNSMEELLSLSYESFYNPSWGHLSVQPTKSSPYKLDLHFKFIGLARIARVDYFNLPIAFDSLKQGMKEFLDANTLQSKMDTLKAKFAAECDIENCPLKKTNFGYKFGNLDTQSFFEYEGTLSNVVIRTSSSIDGCYEAEKLTIQSISLQQISSKLLSRCDSSNDLVEAVIISYKDLSEEEINETFPNYKGRLKNQHLEEFQLKPSMQSFIVTKSGDDPGCCNVSMFMKHDKLYSLMEAQNEQGCVRFAQKRGLGLTLALLNPVPNKI